MVDSKKMDGFLIGIIISGISLLTLSFYIEDYLISKILLVFGTTVFGASFSITIANFKNNSFFNKFYNLIKSSYYSDFSSDEESIKNMRRKYYYYHYTEFEENDKWHCEVLDLSRFSGVGKLNAETVSNNGKGKINEYQFSGIVRDERFIWIEKGKNSNEPVLVGVIPSMGKQYRDVFFGTALLESYKGNQVLTPIIFSENPIDGIGDSDLIDDDKNSKLYNYWKENYYSQVKILI